MIAAGTRTLAVLQLTAVQACGRSAFACVQETEDLDRAACLGKTAARCAKDLARAAKAQEKLLATAERACGGSPPRVPFSDLANPFGLGFGDVLQACQASEGAPVASLSALLGCLARHHQQRAEEMADVSFARTTGLLALLAPDVRSEDLCLPVDSGPGHALASPPAGAKPALRCVQGVQKAAVQFAKRKLALVATCGQALLACQDVDTIDEQCVVKANVKCAKVFDAVTRGEESARRTLERALVDRCVPIPVSELLDPEGLGYAALETICAAVDVPRPQSADDLGRCLARQHDCAASALLRQHLPRLDASLALVGLSLEPVGFTCPPSPDCPGGAGSP